jgi:hypothetical protein
MKPPIVLDNNGDLLFFRDVKHAEAYVNRSMLETVNIPALSAGEGDSH